jgi:hypothetical protein
VFSPTTQLKYVFIYLVVRNRITEIVQKLHKFIKCKLCVSLILIRYDNPQFRPDPFRYALKHILFQTKSNSSPIIYIECLSICVFSLCSRRKHEQNTNATLSNTW